MRGSTNCPPSGRRCLAAWRENAFVVSLLRLARLRRRRILAYLLDMPARRLLAIAPISRKQRAKQFSRQAARPSGGRPRFANGLPVLGVNLPPHRSTEHLALLRPHAAALVKIDLAATTSPLKNSFAVSLLRLAHLRRRRISAYRMDMPTRRLLAIAPISITKQQSSSQAGCYRSGNS